MAKLCRRHSDCHSARSPRESVTFRRRARERRALCILHAVKKIKDEANNQIQVEKDKAISEIRQEVVTLTMLVAEKVIGKNLSVEDNQQLIEKSILDLKKHEA